MSIIAGMIVSDLRMTLMSASRRRVSMSGPWAVGETVYFGMAGRVQALRIHGTTGVPALRGRFPVADWPRDLAGRGRRLYVAAGAAGLVVLDVSPGPPGATILLPYLARLARTD